jgi:hypothetical protein
VEVLVRIANYARSTDVQRAAVSALSCLAGDTLARDAIADAGGITPLIRLVGEGLAEVQQVAIIALGHVGNTHAANAYRIAQFGGIAPLIQVLREDVAMAVRSEAANTLTKLAQSSKKVPPEILKAGGVAPLVRLLGVAVPREGHNVPKGAQKARQRAASALAAIACCDWRCAEAVEQEGALPLLARLAEAEGSLGALDSATALAGLVQTGNEGLRKKAVDVGGILVLLRLLQASGATSQSRCQAARALTQLSRDDDIQRAEILQLGATPLLQRLSQEGGQEGADAADEALAVLTGRSKQPGKGRGPSGGLFSSFTLCGRCCSPDTKAAIATGGGGDSPTSQPTTVKLIGVKATAAPTQVDPLPARGWA